MTVYRAIVYRRVGHRFFDVRVVTPPPPEQVEPMRMGVCFCGDPFRHRCPRCGYESADHRRVRALQQDPEEAHVNAMLRDSLERYARESRPRRDAMLLESLQQRRA